MSLYPERVARCQHIKINGTQCGSPALRHEIYCFFHMRWALKSMEIDENRQRERWNATLSLPEDADSIQMGLGEVIRLMMTRQVDHRTAALTLYALQTASANLKRTSFEPEPTRVVIDRECVERRPIGATAWSAVEGRDYDEVTGDDLTEKRSNEDDSAGNGEQEGNHVPLWRRNPETPENERLLPNESQRDRYIRVQKQRGLEVDPARLNPAFRP
jgi:hypothetical protein